MPDSEPPIALDAWAVTMRRTRSWRAPSMRSGSAAGPIVLVGSPRVLYESLADHDATSEIPIIRPRRRWR
ncbi:hypothetical protein [Nonomuraea dietziae]|uniref:hypothetical protein n=1 Tax=Nonomuraea dietziae TaxID=65515 RepID=UPI0031D330A5